MVLTLARGHYPRSRPTRTTRSRNSAPSVGAQWPSLTDPERGVQKDLDIQEYTDRSTTR
jgi:hypothetical protein